MTETAQTISMAEARAIIRQARHEASLEAARQGITEMNGQQYMADAEGRLTPLELVKAQHKLEDEVVRREIYYAKDISAQIGRFKSHVAEYLGSFDALIEQEYGVTKGGRKGNRTYMSYNGLMKVIVQVADVIDFGGELQVAKTLLDECLNEWSAESNPKIRAIITRAFNTDKQGQVNRAELFMLLRLDIEDPRWQRAMQAIRDAMRVVLSREYIRFYERESVKDAWKAISIDLAKL